MRQNVEYLLKLLTATVFLCLGIATRLCDEKIIQLISHFRPEKGATRIRSGFQTKLILYSYLDSSIFNLTNI